MKLTLLASVPMLWNIWANAYFMRDAPLWGKLVDGVCLLLWVAFVARDVNLAQEIEDLQKEIDEWTPFSGC